MRDMTKQGSRPTPLRTDTEAPDFTLPGSVPAPVKLSDSRGKDVVLVFYPADWSPVCTSELALIQEFIDEIHGRNAEVLGISVDGPYSHRAWARSQKLSFPLLSDFWPHGEVSRRYGVFREGDGTSERALVFIDAAGRVRDVWVAEDLNIAPGIDLLFRGLEAIHGPHREEESHAR
jgi:peroxiredoxin